MAYCTQSLAGITLDCNQNMGGIKTVWLANYNDVLDYAYDDKTGIVTGLTMADEVGINGEKTGKKTTFKPYQFRRGTSSMTSTLTADETNGLSFTTTEVSLVFTKMDTAKRLEMSAIALGQLAVIVLDNNGTYWYITTSDYASASSGVGESGTAKTDRNAYTLVLTSENTDYPYEITKEAVEAALKAEVEE